MDAWALLKPFGVALIPVVLLFAVAAWRNPGQGRLHVVQVVVLAAGVGILCGVIALTLVHTVVSPWRAHRSLGLAYLLPLVAYTATLFAMGLRRECDRWALALASPLGVLLLFCPGMLSALVIQCGVGPCM